VTHSTDQRLTLTVKLGLRGQNDLTISRYSLPPSPWPVGRSRGAGRNAPSTRNPTPLQRRLSRWVHATVQFGEGMVSVWSVNYMRFIHGLTLHRGPRCPVRPAGGSSLSTRTVLRNTKTQELKKQVCCLTTMSLTLLKGTANFTR